LRSFSWSQPPELALVHLGVAVGVVADQDLGEMGVEALDVVAELVAVLEVELVLAGLLDRHGQLEAAALRLLRDAAAELLVDQGPRDARVGAGVGGLEQALVDQVLCVGDRLGLLLVRLALDPEPLLLERPAVVERQDEELAVVAECHVVSLPALVEVGL
jgi:hypothetical protein